MSKKRPNIIFILPDQQRADTLGCAGYDYMITPNLDRLGDEGVIISQCFTQGACCEPARTALFTGRYAHQLNLLSHGRWSGEHNWVELLAQAGYQAVSIGKMHLKPWRSPCGFEYRFVCENKNEPFAPDVEPDEWIKYLAEHGLERPLDYHKTMPDFFDRLGDVEFPLEEKFHEDVFIGTRAIEWIQQRDDNRPLFLHVGFAGPHDPYDAPRRYKQMYADKDIPLPHAIPGELQAKPPEQRQRMELYETSESAETIRLSHATPQRLRSMRAANFGNITLIDEYIGKILHALEAKGLLDDAIVIFCSDHGDAMGDNEMVHKWFMYDSMIHVPMLLWGPKYFGKSRPEAMIELFDVGPTILELAGVEAPQDMQAKSFAPLLRGETSFKGRQYTFCEEKNMAMVRGRQWKLVYYNGRPYGELYDLVNDPHESRNLFDDSTYQDQKAELIDVMEDWYARTGGRCESLERYI